MAWLTGRHIARSRSKHAKGTAKRAAQDQTQNFGISSDEKRMPDENRKSVTRDEGKSPPMEDWLATNAEIQKLAAATPAVAPHSCPHCREWELDIYHHTLNHVKQPSNGQTQHGFTLPYAREKAELGCPFFKRSLQLDPHQRLRPSIPDGAVASLWPVNTDSDPRLDLMWKENGEPVMSSQEYQMYMPHDIRLPTGVLSTHLPPNLVPNSELSYRTAKGWIEDCHKNHAKCSSRPRDFMPARVLHISGIGEEPTIRLSNDHPPAPYATLSYCWGADQPAKTTRANFSSYLSDIVVSTLPPTVRDAAIVARGIGLSYLWVDAMCIIQDDWDDVMVQIAQMHAIYHSSWVTIAAAEAPTCNDGFLQPRSQWQPIRMKARFGEKDSSEVLLVPSGRSCRPEAALFQRGWTMQETLLSSRLLIYGQKELVFLCLERERNEGSVPSDVRKYQMLFDPGSNIYTQLDHPESWGYLVSSYTQRLLAFEGDKLLGIAGLAESYGRTMGVTGYLGGMWKENFLEQCLWTTDLYAVKNGVARHPKEYRAPSWSWASLDGHISSFGVAANMPAMMMPETMPPNITCEVVDVRTTLTAAGNTFGMVSDGELVIRGRLRKLVWHSQLKNNRHHAGHLVKGAKNSQEPTDGVVLDNRMTFMMDCPQDWEGTKDVLLWSLEICKTDTGRGYALLLKEAGHRKGSFQRVGRLDLVEASGLGNWFESDYESREITII